MQTEPVPVVTLSYAPPPKGRRPGILTAVGILSIVIGVLSGFYALVQAGSASMFLMMSGVTARMNAIAATAAQQPLVTMDGIPVSPAGSPDGMDWAQRQKIIDALDELHPMSALHREHLDLLLMNSGRKLFPFVTENTTKQEIGQKVQVPSGSTDLTGETFILPDGVLRIVDANATFTPDERADEIVQATGRSATPVVPRETSEVVAMTVSAGGGATGPATAPATSFPVFQVDPTAAKLTIGVAAASALLAVFLLVAGIMLLCNSRRARRMHWIYVLAKPPLVVVACIAYVWLQSSMMSRLGMTGVNWRVALVPSAVFWGLLGLSYPVALLIVLRTRTVKEFFDHE